MLLVLLINKKCKITTRTRGWLKLWATELLKQDILKIRY